MKWITTVLGAAVGFLLLLFGWQREKHKREVAEDKAERMEGQQAVAKKVRATVKQNQTKGKTHVKKAVDRARSGKRDHFE